MCNKKNNETMRDIRVRRDHVERKVELLLNRGYIASWRKGCHTRFGNGCSDPECCRQHVSYGNQDDWATITTNCSGNKAHALWLEN